MNQHFQSYLIGSAILTILWWIIQYSKIKVFCCVSNFLEKNLIYSTGSSISTQVDPGGNFSGASATTQSLEGFIQEVQQLPQ